jgi:hypothetical protein
MNPLKTAGKALVLGLVVGAFGFFGGVFLGLVAQAMIGGVSGTRPDYTLSYRFVGAGLGIIGFVAGAVTSLIRDARTLSRNSE